MESTTTRILGSRATQFQTHFRGPDGLGLELRAARRVLEKRAANGATSTLIDCQAWARLIARCEQQLRIAKQRQPRPDRRIRVLRPQVTP